MARIRKDAKAKIHPKAKNRTRPAATETGPEQAGPADGTAGPSPGPEGSAPPAMGVVATDQPASEAFRAATDQSQERLEKQAEEPQPLAPVLERVLARLSRTIDEPFGEKHATTEPPTRLHGAAVELNTRLYEAMVAEGVVVHTTGDTLQFLLEGLDESIRKGF